ncbi:DinB family protein [Chitinophaga niabensis]|uniref:Uncharacterized damage-inducible protein DinB (Forms a four-helix bundle) n=1 Tax=Chitinophaga niabensis TaxID=536979 RepID=A0A1N6DW39_9BACT|nr:DinB family protein [Chitinophaga niabensis]SIN74923.1 Uncharacterized damage-inducible protein DinB (forms a four-helix bundle) [Chitinophaga niabensis]
MDLNSAKLCRYNNWANGRMFMHLKGLPDGLIFQPVQSVFPSVFDTLVHMYIVDTGWFEVLATPDYQPSKERIDKLVEATKGCSLEEIEALLAGVQAKYLAFVETQDMNSTVFYWGMDFRYGDIVQNVVNHGTYHRGNITAMLRQLGHTGIQQDYSLYLYTFK